MSKKMLIVLSGGQDSTSCLFWTVSQPWVGLCKAVCFDYGQRHIRELDSAQRVAAMAGVPIEFIKVGNILESTSPLVNRNEELEQYKDHQSLPGGLEKTFVPMRNQLFLTLAANRAIAWGAHDMVTGVCQEDFGGYPDCRRAFILAVEAAIRLGSSLDPDYEFRIHTPLMDLTKAESVNMALGISGCYEALGWSHTAYDGAYPPTGKDHATLLRAKGFEEAGVPDPLILRAYWDGGMELPSSPNYQQFASELEMIKFMAGISFAARITMLRKDRF